MTAISPEEALRYAGVPHPTAPLLAEMTALAEELERRITPRWVWRVFPVRSGAEGAELGGGSILLLGDTARQMLAGCRQAAVLVCTLGAAFDRLLLETQRRDMGRALLLDACGSAYTEAACGMAEEEISARLPGLFRTDRFSPGYGDLPLTVQPGLLAAVDAERRAGVTLTDSLLMTPMKSVSAIIGLADTPRPARIRGCAHCALRGRCAYRAGRCALPEGEENPLRSDGGENR